MQALREEHLVGIDYLEAVTALLQRGRNLHPTKGLYEAAEVQWWWGEISRATDELPQLFWFDDLGRPVAAAIITEWSYGVQVDLIVMPDATPDWVAQVVERGLAHAADAGFGAVQLEVDRADSVMRDILGGHGFGIEEDGLVESWLAADARPAISALQEGYRLSSRLTTMDRPHHMCNAARSRPDPELRLRQTSLYRPDLDLVVHDANDQVAAYGMFWYDPATSTGTVEPMRTEDEHQRRGLARHVLTTGIKLLVEAGAERIKICYEPDNPASGHLYRSCGFEPVKHTDVFSGHTGVRTASANLSPQTSVDRTHRTP